LRRIVGIMVAGLLAAGMVAEGQAQSKDKGEAFVGSWAGKWTGGSEGALELTISKADGKLAGSITGTPSSGNPFTASFKTVAVEGGTLTATFDVPPDGGPEATLTATLEGGDAKGAYTLKEKAQGSVVETGTWSASRKK
jgi:hypothetical protein